MKGYKGFNKNLKCKDYQYEIGKTYETDKAKLCEEGFHFCESPLDVLRYYGNRNGNRYCEVTADNVSEETGDDSKRVAKTLKIGAEIGLPGLIKAHFDYVRATAESGTAGGYGSNLAGGYSSNLAGGNWSNLAGGDSSNLAGGDRSNLAGGDWSLIIGKNQSKAKAGFNSVIVLTEWKYVDNMYKPTGVKAEIVDGERIKADTWYKLVDGEFRECSEDDDEA